jgi:hypothetical protein
MKAGIYRCTRWSERERTEMSRRRDQSERPRIRFLQEVLRLENFPFVVLFVLAILSLISRLWLMFR